MSDHDYKWLGKYPSHWLKTLWDWVASSPINPESELGYLSRLLNGILLIIIFLGTVAEVIFLASNRTFNFIDALSFATILLLILVYAINRRGHFELGIALTIMLLVLAIYALFWFGTGDVDANKVLNYLVFPILLADFFLSQRAFSVAVIITLAVMLHYRDMPGISNIFVFLVIFSTLAGFSKRLRGQLEQKRQWRLQEAERKYRTLVENVPAITYVNKADRNGRALYVSPQTQTLLGIPPEEWMSDGVSTRFSLIHPDDIDRVWTKFDCFLENGAPLDLEYRVKAPDGRLLWIQDRAIMLRDDSGYPDSIQGVMHDVTERKQTEEKLRRTEKELQTLNAELEKRVAERTAEFNRTNAELERASCAKDEFLANMSHELRTPLNSILGLSESLLEERRGSLNNYQQKSLQIIGSSGQHLLELINDILDLSKIQAGKFDFYPQNISVADLCRSSLSFVKAQAAKKFIELNYDNQSAVTEIFADARRLKQALVNLLTNAVKFTAQHGHVTLRVTTKLEQNLIQFSVIDDGVGIALEDLQRLFQPFVQVDSSLNRQYEGTGLGLALVQKLIDLHAGSIEVISEVGKGSCFTLNLACSPNGITKAEETSPPIEYAARETSENVEISESPAHERVILLAEDNMSNVLTIGEYLESHDYKVIVAHDGVEAITKAMESNPELILMDIQMPAMNGLEAIAHLRADLRFAATPIIALTALAMPGDRERCLQVGANEYMSKPVSLKMLAKTIESMLKLGRAK